MGQQQLLLIVLGVIVVGIAIVVGINLFNASAVNANRDAVVSDLNNIGALAISHFKKPTSMGGGGQKFTGFEIPTKLEENANGTYTIASTEELEIIFEGEGVEIGDDGTTVVKFTCTVDNLGDIEIVKDN
jgi:hypothetical protein